MSGNDRKSIRNAAIQGVMQDGESLKNLYRFTAQNPHFELYEAIQIVLNRPNASVCYEFSEWNAMDRRVTKGRKGIPYYDRDGTIHFVFDMNDTHGAERYYRPILPMKHIIDGFDELHGTNYREDKRSDYRKIHNGVVRYLDDNGYLSGDELKNRILIEGVTFSLYSKTGFPKDTGVKLHALPYDLNENAELVKQVYLASFLIQEAIEETYERTQKKVEVIDDTEEDTLSDEPIVTPPQAEEEHSEPQRERVIDSESKKKLSPMYERYLSVQEMKPQAVVVQRLGDFYEIMGENAKIVAQELDLTLTGRSVGVEERVPMCGFPYHASDKYLEKILENHSVVVIEDEGEPKYILSHEEAKGLDEEKKPELVEADEEETPFDDEYEDDDEEEEKKPVKKKDTGKPIKQRKHKEKTRKQASFFDMLDDDREETEEEKLTKWAMLRGSGFTHGKYRIVEEYETNPTENEFADFLKNEYGTGGMGDGEYDMMHDGKGLRAKRKLPEREVVINLNWHQIAVKIADMIDDGEYFDGEETLNYKRFLSERHGSDEERIKAVAENIITHVLNRNDNGKGYQWTSNCYAGYGFIQDHSQEIVDTLNADDRVISAGRQGDHFELDCSEYSKDGTRLTPDEKRARAIIQKVVEDGTQNTESLSWVTFYDELGADEQFAREHRELLERSLSKREEVVEFIVTDEGMDCVFYGDYCPSYQEFDDGLLEAAIENRDLDEEEDEEWERRLRSGEIVEGKPKQGDDNTDLTEVGFDQSELGGAKTRFKGNVEAIKLMEQLYQENRNPTREEKKVLAKYVGWGGLAQAFDERNENWKKEYGQLKELLSPEDYETARGSVLNAHFTPKEVIGGMYSALTRFGVQGNNKILEPAMGTGNFFGFMPKEIAENSKLYGVELDSLTGRIAQKLYPQAKVQIKGFEDTTFSNDSMDIVVGNVPFGGYSVYDPDYSRYSFLIHDYFLAKSIDKLRAGGIMAVITTKGTMDKLNPSARKYYAARAELLGAIRLPNTAFKQTAGTEAVADILFFKKRDYRIEPTEENTEWLSVGKTEEGFIVNNYFIKHPEMVLGYFVEEHGLYGAIDITVHADERTLSDALQKAVARLPEQVYEVPTVHEEEQETIELDYNVKPLRYKTANGKLYMRMGDRMVEQTIPNTPKDAYDRIDGMIKIRESIRHVLQIQADGCSNEVLEKEQEKLNRLYDSFVRKYGILNSSTNTRLFREDGDSALVFSCEVLSEDKKTATKADVFRKRTIRPEESIVPTTDCLEALQICKNEKGRIDIAYIEEMTKKDYDTVLSELGNAVFRDPEQIVEGDKYSGFETADQYLSGNVVKKLGIAKLYQGEEFARDYAKNVAALEAVQPTPIKASEIAVRLGSSWVDKAYYEQFISELLDIPYFYRDELKVYYNSYDSSYRVDRSSGMRRFSAVKVSQTYGTERANAFRLIEDLLNQRATTIYDTIETENGEKREVNQRETIAAREKQNKIAEEFKRWLFANPERRDNLERAYNSIFNQIRLPSYDGSYLKFPGMNPAIELNPHQKDAVHRILLGDNTLLHHVVGAGKTYTAIASIMKMKQYGIANKTMVVVPNHIVEQWANDWRNLYPNANILVATKEDLEKKNRQKFVSKVALGDWDGIIIASSSFAKITVSPERRAESLQREMDSITASIEKLEDEFGSHGAIKNLERIKKSREAELKKLMDDSKKDDVLSFEQLGVDFLVIDEAHYYKNLFLYSKMTNVAGISSAASQRATDLKLKCEYLGELRGGDKGVVFLTGTPISNSMTEMYTMQTYLQQNRLREMGITFFDGWAADFGETITSLELAPSGQGYKARTRFAKFTNLPELLKLYRSFADVKTSDMIKLQVPEAEKVVVTLKPSDTVLLYADEIAKRAERINKGSVDPHIDNMLKVTSDGKKLALDPRCFEPTATDEEGSKLNECATRIFEIWEETKDILGTQIVFCDLSTPKKPYSEYVYGQDFDVYSDLKHKLIERGIPEEEIAFIHDAKNDKEKQTLFDNVNSGKVRVIIGSTEKCGAGTNVQRRLVALHHLDTPYRPSDMEQREGRIIRQGNMNKSVKIFTYVTERTFDSYSYQILENKQRFISQINHGDLTVREAEDIDETTLSYAEIKAITAANPKIKRKMEVDAEVSRLHILEGQYRENLYSLQDKVRKDYPEGIARAKKQLENVRADMVTIAENFDKEHFRINVGGVTYTDRKLGSDALTDALYASTPETVVAEYGGLKISMEPMSFMATERSIRLMGAGSYTQDVGMSPTGNMTRIDNFFLLFADREKRLLQKIEELERNLEQAKEQILVPFEHEQRLIELQREQAELNAELDLNRREEVIIDDGGDGEETVGMAVPERKIRKRKQRTMPDKETETNGAGFVDEIASLTLPVQPDYTVDQEKMHEYGYMWDGMLPLNIRSAERLYDLGLPVYRLGRDDTEGEVNDGMFDSDFLYGVEKPAWKHFMESKEGKTYLAARMFVCGSASKVVNTEMSYVDELFIIGFNENNFAENSDITSYMMQQEMPDAEEMKPYMAQLIEEFTERVSGDYLASYGWTEQDVTNSLISNVDVEDLKEYAQEQDKTKRVRRFIDQELHNIRWLEESGGEITEDNIDDIVNDLKSAFEESEIYAESGDEFYDEWYDDISDEYIEPYLKEKIFNADEALQAEIDGMTVEEVEDLLTVENEETPEIEVEWHLKTPKDYLSLVRESVEKEYAEFEKYELTRTPEQLLHEDNYKIRFFNELSGFFQDDYCEGMYDRDFEALYRDSPNILDLLYDYYLDSEYVSINNYDDTQNLIQYYNERYHNDVVADRYDHIGYRPLPDHTKIFGEYKNNIYYYIPNAVTLDSLQGLEKNSIDGYVIASQECQLTEEEKREHKVAFMKIGTEINAQEISHPDALWGMVNAYEEKMQIEGKKRLMQERMDCKTAIEQGIAKNFDGMHLNKGFEEDIIDGFGIVLIEEVLANTVQHKMEDGRFSLDTKAWAKDWEFSETETDRNRWVVDSHPAVLDGVINRIRNYGKEEEETEMPEREKKKWLTATVAKDALIRRYEKHSFMRMPTGEYEDYTYNIFNSRIKDSRQIVDNQSDTRELAYDISLSEDQIVLLRTRDGDEVEMTAQEFIAEVDKTTSERYPVKREEDDKKWFNITVPKEAMKGMYESSSLFVAPTTSTVSGSFYVPNRFLDENTESDDGSIQMHVPESMKFTVKDRDGGKTELSAYQLYELMDGTKASDYARTQRTENKPQTQEQTKKDGWLSVKIPKVAVIASYDENTLIKMPVGKYGGHTYYIPTGMVKEAKEGDGKVLRIPEDFTITVRDKRKNTQEVLTAQAFVDEVKDKEAGAYTSVHKPTDEANQRFAEVEKRLREHLPDKMKNNPNWVIVRTRWNEEKDKADKFLIDCHTGKFAKSDDPATWTDFESACKYARENGGVALAYALDGKGGIACIDLDHCIENGAINDFANKVIDLSENSFTECSVSGNGVHIWGKTNGMDLRAFSQDGDLEFYQKGHFITMTGDMIVDTGMKSFDTKEMTEFLESKCARRTQWQGAGAGVEGLSMLSDREVVEKASSAKNGDIFARLYRGEDLQNNHSNSDMSLMNRLAYWCNGDKEQMLRIFATSGLYRPDKSPDYYESTVIKAIKDTTRHVPPTTSKPTNGFRKSGGNGSSK